MSTICKICGDLDPTSFVRWKNPDPRNIVEESRSLLYIVIKRKSLAVTASNGCKMCKIIDRATKEVCAGPSDHLIPFIFVFTPEIGQPLRFDLMYGVYGAISLFSLPNSSYWNRRPSGCFSGHLYTLNNDRRTDLYPGIGRARNIPVNALSHDALDLARQWLNDCVSTHGECQGTVVARLPTRVIDVGSTTGKLFLLESKGREGQYATLSHCWGGTFPLTTTLATYEARTTTISFNEFPKTFQDAVVVTRHLGIPFLWIDSLCIIQDSKEDWLEESVRMQEVYEKAILNISADDACDSTVGLSSSRRAIATGILINEDGIYASRRHSGLDYSGLSHSYQDPDDSSYRSILSTRAWVLQERMLSPRVLHFRAHELAWECDTHIRCECSIEPRPADQRSFRALSYQFGNKKGNLARALAVESVEAGVWGKILNTYTQLSLSHESDALNAISGLAARIARHTAKTYIAGLWKEDFPWSLLWRCASPSSNYGRREKYFPSWSWASIRAPITYELSDIKGANPSSSSVLCLKIRQITCENQETRNFQDRSSGLMCVFGWAAKVTISPQERRFELSMGIHKFTVNQTKLHLDVEDGSKLTKSVECYILLVALGTELYSLVLRKLDDSLDFAESQKYYQRIGVLEMDSECLKSEDLMSQFELEEVALL
ncbi:hypothetical protein EG329_003112 [Mollisiaceae sp. DMI_Dod_QoI]|nr:hypothetical protein EG329_003112 [Helotiales sp. DMI_Dod_QoI]